MLRQQTVFCAVHEGLKARVPSYVLPKVVPILEIFKMAGYFPDNHRT